MAENWEFTSWGHLRFHSAAGMSSAWYVLRGSRCTITGTRLAEGMNFWLTVSWKPMLVECDYMVVDGLF